MSQVKCLHKDASVHRSTIVDSATGRRLRSYCNDCRHFVETVPRVEKRTGRVFDTGWLATTGQQTGQALDL